MAEIVSASIGAVLGGVVVLLWNALGSRFGEERFWPSFRQLTRDLAAGAPPEQVLRQYGELLKLLALYVGKMTCRVSIVILPVLLCCTLLAPLVFDWSLENARELIVHPPQNVHASLGNDSLTFGPDGLAGLPEGKREGPVRIVTPVSDVDVSEWNGPLAVSDSPWTCLGLQLLGLDAHHVAAGPPLVILRPYLDDGNPLFPFLSDVEFSFWAGLLGSSLAVGLAMKMNRKEVNQP